MSKVIVIGVAGGSGSGKTTFARRLQNDIGLDLCDILAQDSYYIDQSDKFDHDGGSVNFDHPDALEFSLMAKHISKLKSGQSINIPTYDFATHTRVQVENVLTPKKIVLVDGILLYSQDQIVSELDHRIFIDCPESLRFERRLNRDVKERGRTPEGVKAQFQAQVKPMHDQYVEPSKKHACDMVSVEDFDRKCDKWLSFIKDNYL